MIATCFRREVARAVSGDSVYPTFGKLGEDLEVEIRGSGFDQNTRVTVSVDTGNTESIIGNVDSTENN